MFQAQPLMLSCLLPLHLLVLLCNCIWKQLPNWTLHMKCLRGTELSYSGPGHVLCINAESLPQEIMSSSLVPHTEFWFEIRSNLIAVLSCNLLGDKM